MGVGGGSPRFVVGRYALYDALASGGMATVYIGRMLGPAGFSRTVAIKRLHEHFGRDPHFVAGLLDEARLSTRIAHPNVVPTLDVVSTDEQLLLVMEYVQGESLATLLRLAAARREHVPLRVAIGIMAGVLHGLHAAHEAQSETGAPLNLVHRDVSPQNVIVGVDGVARVLDFGVAKAAGRLQDTETGQRKGKVSYMAPEQIRSEPVDRRTDVFAASVVLWELLTNKRLFAADNDAATMGRVLSGPIDLPSQHSPEVPPELDAALMRGLARDPTDRYASAQAMALALEEVASPATVGPTGQWVVSLAGDTLTNRAKRVREIESATVDRGRTRDAEADAEIHRPHDGGSTSDADPLRVQEARTGPLAVSVAQIVARRLAVYLGPHTARVAVKTFSIRAVGRGAETLTVADVPNLQASLRPMLRQLIGRVQCEYVLTEISRELGL
jgi:serine/threonine protein kinase